MSKIYKNIACVQINLSDDGYDFYFPDNVLFHDKIINTIELYAAPTAGLQSPFDGRTLIGRNLLDCFYLDVVKDSKDILHQNVNAMEVDVMGNSRITINQKVDFTMTKLSFYDNTATSLDGKCILAYVSFDEIEDENYTTPRNSVTVSVTTSDQRILVADILDEWIQRRKQNFHGVSCKCQSGSHFYLSLRETTGKVFELVPSDMLLDNSTAMRPINNHQMWFDYDLDFKNSWIYNATSGSITFDLTFYY